MRKKIEKKYFWKLAPKVRQDKPGEHIKSALSNRQDRKISGSSAAILYWGFLGILVMSNSESTTCGKTRKISKGK